MPCVYKRDGTITHSLNPTEPGIMSFQISSLNITFLSLWNEWVGRAWLPLLRDRSSSEKYPVRYADRCCNLYSKARVLLGDTGGKLNFEPLLPSNSSIATLVPPVRPKERLYEGKVQSHTVVWLPSDVEPPWGADIQLLFSGRSWWGTQISIPEGHLRPCFAVPTEHFLSQIMACVSPPLQMAQLDGARGGPLLSLLRLTHRQYS